MRSNYWNLVWGILGVIMIIINIRLAEPTKTFLGMEINSWVYRGFWLLISISSFVAYFKRRKKESN